jgi:hypothetical protein
MASKRNTPYPMTPTTTMRRRLLMPPISCIHFLRLKPAGRAIPKGRKARGSNRQNQRRKTGIAIKRTKNASKQVEEIFHHEADSRFVWSGSQMKLAGRRVNWRKQAISQACAFRSPFPGILSVMAIFRQTTTSFRVQRIRVQIRATHMRVRQWDLSALPCRQDKSLRR